MHDLSKWYQPICIFLSIYFSINRLLLVSLCINKYKYKLVFYLLSITLNRCIKVFLTNSLELDTEDISLYLFIFSCYKQVKEL